MKKIFGFLLVALLFLSFVTEVRASTVLDINTTDCSGLGGTGNGGNMAGACNNTVNTENGTLLTAWGDNGHPVIHIVADLSDTLNLTINTPGVFIPNNTYTAIEWTTTLTNWNGWIGGAMFDCNGNWGCPTVTFAPGGGSGWQGSATATGHTDYYIVVVSQCQGISSGCYSHLTISCSSCSVAGLSTPQPLLPKLTVTKQVTNDNGGNAVIGDFTLKVGDTTVVSGETNTFDAGTYTVSETGPTGYTSTFSGDCDSNGQITLNANDQKTCTITNDDIAPSLTLTKHVVNGNSLATDWTLTATGTATGLTPISGSGSVTSGPTFSAGTYALSESSGPNNYSSGMWTCTGATINENSITLSLGQSANCEITNTYVAPTPSTTKVVLLPGGGASWNADAILNCKESNDWTMAPYADDVYKNLLPSLSSSNWNVKPFYYDWRRDVRDNVSLLSSFINSNTSNGEKVNLVGHSMGGLISRAYLESVGGNKVDSFISAGSPYQGIALAYPVWSGGEVWDDNLVSKIATTILLKRCGSKIPSIQNLLPTTDFLRDSKTNQLKPVAGMIAKNNWLPTNFSIPFGNVRIGTLSGTGFPTINVIKVNSPSKNDIQRGIWLDGKPMSKEKNNLGDGTVLISSSQLNNADNQVINQNHAGLVASQEGISKILGFLGTAPAQGFRLVTPVLAHDKPDKSIYVEPKSMLVIIGYPGNFWITDKNGNVTHDEEGMISLANPVSGNYKLDVVPTQNDTLFIITQILSNGQTLYKEYHLTNLQPKTKIIEFDSKHPREDLLKDKDDYRKPRILFDWWKFFLRFSFKH